MAGEIQLNSTTMATESSGSITAELDTIRPNTTNGSLTLQGDSSSAGVTGLTIDSSGNATFAQTITGGTIGSGVVFPGGHYKKYAQYALFYVNAMGGTATSGSWQTYPLNTVIDNSDLLVTSFSSNQVTVSAGTYLFFLRGAFYLTYGSNLRLYNVTSSTAVGNEFNVYASSAAIISGCVKATFTVSTTLKMEYYVESTNADDGLGIDRGVNQQYGDLTIFQIT